MAEASLHPENTWVTLTYSPDNLPPGGTLVPSHLSGFIKRLRRNLEYRQGPKIRFFGCGEYGEQKLRPHYHVFLFGLGPTWHEVVSASWTHGNLMFAHDPSNAHLIQYTAGYTVKKMEKVSDVKDRKLHPEFARMSLKPALGAEVVRKFYAAAVESGPVVQRIFDTVGDAPAAIMFNGKFWPIGKTLQRVAREELGLPRDLTDAHKRELTWVRAEAQKANVGKREQVRQAGERKARVNLSLKPQGVF